MADVTADKIVSQLRALLQLTESELQLATVRRTQARTEAVERELAENAENSEERRQMILAALSEMGGVPDVVTPALGRLTAVVKSSVEQAQPLHEALLGELALEHQLLDRALYLRVLATAAKKPEVLRLADRLVTAHTATVEWLTTVLAEDGLGGPTALRRTPVQLVTGAALRLTSLPVRTMAERVNEAIAQVRAERDRVSDTLSQARQTMVDLRDGAVEVLGTSRDTGLARAELVARRDGATATAESLHEARRANGSLDPSELPIADYDELKIADAVAEIKELTKPEDVRAILAYEEAHKARSGVVSATQTRLAAIAKETLGV
jgi:hypothetical protein